MASKHTVEGDMVMKIEKIPKYTVILGLALLAISGIIPEESLEFIFGEGFRFAGLVILLINPVLGIIGIIFSIITKNWKMIIPNLLLVFTIFIMMIIGYLLFGP